MERDRLKYIDVMRGFGILIMVAGHVGFGSYFDRVIHAFHMPLFFFISGYIGSHIDRSYSGFVKKRFKRLIITYLFYCTLYMCMKAVLEYFRYGECEISGYVWHMLWNNTEGLPVAGALWFLTATFFTDVIYAFIGRCISFEYRKDTAVDCLCVAVGILFSFFPMTFLPWSAGSGLVGLGFYGIGHLVRNTVESKAMVCEQFPSRVFLVALLVITLVSSSLSPAVNMRTNSYPLPLLFWLNAVLALICLLCSFEMLPVQVRSRWASRLVSLLEYMGKESIGFLCWNQFVIAFVTRIFSLFPVMYSGSLFLLLIFKLLVFVLVVFLLVSVCKVRSVVRAIGHGDYLFFV